MIASTTLVLAASFHKYEGLGNDFVVVEASHPDAIALARAAAPRVCDRRFGVGGDGILVVLPGTEGSAARMVVVNADGSVPEMCGNGLRCVALHVARARGLVDGTLVFDTDAGAKSCVIDDREGQGIITVDMGLVRFVEDTSVEIDGASWPLALGDAGNPHAITFEPASRATIDAVGPRISTHPRFPAGTNVEFVSVVARDRLDLVVWERGVGVTHACGTGACATVAVAVAKGHCDVGAEVSVRLPGGELRVTALADGRAIMRGPARHVFSGALDAGFEAAQRGGPG